MKQWFNWIGIALLISIFLRHVVRLYRYGYSLRNLAVVIGVPILLAWYFWAVRQPDPDEEDEEEEETEGDEKPLVSIVLLLSEPRYLDAAILARLASRAWNVEVTTDEAEFFAVGEAPVTVIKGPDGVFLVHNHDRPYVPEVKESAANIMELRLRTAVERHRAWASVDLVQLMPESTQSEAYRAIGRLVAELADEDCLALYGTESRRLVCYAPELDEQLRGDEPLAALDYHLHPPVVEVADDDPEMQAAVSEARRRWPEFVAAFEERAPGELFSVKAKVTDGEHSEFIWINVTALEGDRIVGRLGNAPVALRGRREGDVANITVGELNDWLYLRQNEPVGGFTVKVVARHMKGGDTPASEES